MALHGEFKEDFSVRGLACPAVRVVSLLELPCSTVACERGQKEQTRVSIQINCAGIN